MANSPPTGSLQLLSQIQGLSTRPLSASDITNAATQRFNPSNNHIYEFVDSVVTWPQALQLASQKSISGIFGYLATVTSSAEQVFLATNNTGLIGPWIGGSDSQVADQWQWVTGPEAGSLFWLGGVTGTTVNGAFANWMAGEPNNFAGSEKYLQDYLGPNPIGWNDNSGSFLSPFIVEYSGSITTNVSDKAASGPDFAVGKALFAGTTSFTDADGLGTFRYQWQRSSDGQAWQDISGATALSYTLQSADGYQFVRASVSYVDGARNSETIASASSKLVSPTGTDGNDSIQGRLTVPPLKFLGDNTQYYIDGRSGFDVVNFDTQLVTNGRALQVTVQSDKSIAIGFQTIGLSFGPIATLVNVEEAKFSDYTLIFDLNSAQDKLVYQIYQAAYARVPDHSGFRFWASLADANNLSAIALADAFLAAPEYLQKYGTPDNQNYVAELYTNVLGRPPDQSGLAFWTNIANQGTPRDQLLVGFATSAENLALILPHVSSGFWTT